MGVLSDRLAVLINQMQDSDRQQQELINGMLTTTRQHLDKMSSITESIMSDLLEGSVI